MRLVQVLKFELKKRSTSIAELNNFLFEIQNRGEDNRIINVQILDNIAYITAAVDLEELINNE